MKMKKMIGGLLAVGAALGLSLSASAGVASSSWVKLNGSNAGLTIGTNGKTTYYYITENTTCDTSKSGTAAGTSGLTIAAGATVYLYIPPSVTLTCKGKEGSGKTGGGAGIHLPSNSKLYVIGNGTLTAQGGAAAAGSNGTDGAKPNSNALASGICNIWPPSLNPNIVWIDVVSGSGGTGGAGGGGGGAGIGTPGGSGGSGGAGGVGYGVGDTEVSHFEVQNGRIVNNGSSGCYGASGTAGGAGSAAAGMGTLYIQSTIAQKISGGAASTSAGSYVNASVAATYKDVSNSLDGNHVYRAFAFPGAGGGGGGSGYAGANIGTGGGGGGGGAGGQAGGTGFADRKYSSTHGVKVNAFVGGGGVGNSTGAGSTTKSPVSKTSSITGFDSSHTDTWQDTSLIRYGGAGGGAGTAKTVTSATLSVTVTLEPQNGGKSSSVTANVGEAQPKVTMPTKSGYTVTGYFNATTDGEQYYNSDGTSARPAWCWNYTLYAQWAANSYTVTLNQQSGSGGTASVTATYGSGMPTAKMPGRTGYAFGGYYTGTGGTGTQYYTDKGASARNWDKASDTTLYAKWTANTYKVTLKLQNGSADGSVTATYNSGMPKATMPTRTGYTFLGFFDAQTGGNKYYNADGTSARNWTTANVGTLYGQWKANNYAVTLDAQGGAGGTPSVTATFDAAMPTATAPTRTGYTFGGYFTGTGGAGTRYYNANGTSAASWTTAGAGTLYAQWTAKGYTLELDNGDGKSGSVTATYDAMPPAVVAPVREGMAFRGYFTEPEGAGTRIYDANGVAGEPWTTDGGMTLHALWLEQVAESEDLTISSDLREVKPAQVFKPEMLVTSPTGWEAETAAIFEAIGEGQPVAVVEQVTAPITVWTPQDVGLFTLTHTAGDGEETAQFNVTGFTYRVEFDANGGSGDAMAGVDLAYGAEGTAPACTYERTDYEFSGWNTRKDGSGTAIAVGGKYKNLVTDASETGYLYAQWTLKTAYEFHVDVKEGGQDPVIEKINLPTAWLEKNLPPDVDKSDSAKVKEELEKKDETGLKTWQKYVLGVDKDDKSAKVWIDSPQQKAKDKIKVTMKEYSPTKGTGFTVKYRLDTELKGKEKAKGNLENSPDFDIDLSGDKDPTGLYTVNVVFVPDGKTDSDEVVESVNTMGILKVPSQKTLEIVAVPWNRLAPDANQAVLVADLVKTATLTPGDKLHVYDRAKKTYKSWKYDIEKGWVALGTFKVTAAGLEQTLAPDQTEQTVARGSAVWLERQDASKPFYLYGQYSKDAVETKISARQHNLIASPKMEPFDLNGGGITGDIGANDQIIVPQGGDKPPKTYTYRSGTGWGYSKFVNGRFTFDTTDDEVPVGTGFWYISKGGSPTIRW